MKSKEKWYTCRHLFHFDHSQQYHTKKASLSNSAKEEGQQQQNRKIRYRQCHIKLGLLAKNRFSKVIIQRHNPVLERRKFKLSWLTFDGAFSLLATTISCWKTTQISYNWKKRTKTRVIHNTLSLVTNKPTTFTVYFCTRRTRKAKKKQRYNWEIYLKTIQYTSPSRQTSTTVLVTEVHLELCAPRTQVYSTTRIFSSCVGIWIATENLGHQS